MKLFKKLIRPLLIAVGVVLIVNLIHSGHTMWASFVIILLLLSLTGDLRERLGNIETNLKKTEDNLKQPLCYKIRLDVSPKWAEFLPEKKYSSELVNKLYADTELEINKEKSLLYKNFRYTIFIDETSGLKQVWSDFDKEFLDNYDISGNIIEIDNYVASEKLLKKYNVEYGNDLTGWIIISPSRIGYCHKYLELPTIDKNRILSQIPYESIIESLKKEHICGGSFMTEDLKKKLDENNVQYETWNKEAVQLMFNHIFSAKYYSLSINIEFFDKWGE